VMRPPKLVESYAQKNIEWTDNDIERLISRKRPKQLNPSRFFCPFSWRDVFENITEHLSRVIHDYKLLRLNSQKWRWENRLLGSETVSVKIAWKGHKKVKGQRGRNFPRQNILRPRQVRVISIHFRSRCVGAFQTETRIQHPKKHIKNMLHQKSCDRLKKTTITFHESRRMPILKKRVRLIDLGTSCFEVVKENQLRYSKSW
jgi:hypothetical protein